MALNIIQTLQEMRIWMFFAEMWNFHQCRRLKLKIFKLPFQKFWPLVQATSDTVCRMKEVFDSSWYVQANWAQFCPLNKRILLFCEFYGWEINLGFIKALHATYLRNLVMWWTEQDDQCHSRTPPIMPFLWIGNWVRSVHGSWSSCTQPNLKVNSIQ